MAEAKAVQSLNCPVCHEGLKEPKILTCTHLVCCKCVLSVLKKKRRSGKSGCPVCQTPLITADTKDQDDFDAFVDELPTDHATSVKVECQKTITGSSLCAVCDSSSEAEFFCFECDTKLCSTCTKVHSKLPSSSNHTVEKCGSLTVEQLAAKKCFSCSSHKEETAKLYCSVHEELVCYLCASSSHRKCDGIEEITSAAGSKRQGLEEQKTRLTDKQASLSAEIKDCENRVTEAEVKFAEMRDKVITVFSDLIKSLENQKHKLLGELHQKEQIFLDEKLANKKELEAVRSSAEAHVNTIDMLLSSESHHALLATCVRLNSRLNKVESEEALTADDATLGDVYFEEKMLKGLKSTAAVIGEVRDAPPEEIQKLDKSKRHDSSVDLQPGQKTSKADKDLEGAHDGSGSDSSHSEEPSGHYTLPVPLECLQKEDLDTFLKQMYQFKPQVHEKNRVPSLQFCLKTREEWESALEKVHEYIHEHGKTRKPEGSLVSHLQQQSQKQGHSFLTRELDSVVAGSLKVLMKEDFSKMKEEQIGNDKVKLSCSGPTAHDIMNKMDSLRHEEMLLGPEDLQKISTPMDTSEEGVAAYMVPVPLQGKVIIFCFDLNAVSKAKHLLNVKLGKVKVIARSRRRFEDKYDSGGDEASSHSPPSSLGHKSSTANAAEFNTKSGIKVSVYKTDITKLPVDAIVNAANERLAHGGGVAYAISRAAGYELDDDGQEYIKVNGPLRVREVVVTTAGSLPCKKVLHALGPRWYEYTDKALFQQHLVDTVYNCLHKASTMQLTSLAISSTSAAIFGVPKEVCAVSYLSAVQNFEKDCGRDTSVSHVHFVDVNDDMINAVQETFKQNWNTDICM